MPRYIELDTLLVEIEKRLNELYELLPDASKVENGNITISEACNTGKYTALESFRRFIDTIKVEEVDLEKEIELVKGDYEQVDVAWNNDFDFIARHFYELGLKQK